MPKGTAIVDPWFSTIGIDPNRPNDGGGAQGPLHAPVVVEDGHLKLAFPPISKHMSETGVYTEQYFFPPAHLRSRNYRDAYPAGMRIVDWDGKVKTWVADEGFEETGEALSEQERVSYTKPDGSSDGTVQREGWDHNGKWVSRGPDGMPVLSDGPPGTPRAVAGALDELVNDVLNAVTRFNAAKSQGA